MTEENLRAEAEAVTQEAGGELTTRAAMLAAAADLYAICNRIRDHWDCGGGEWWRALEDMCDFIGRSPPVQVAPYEKENTRYEDF